MISIKDIWHRIVNYDRDVDELNAQLTNLYNQSHDKIDTLNIQITQLNDQILKQDVIIKSKTIIKPSVDDADYWNNKWNKSTIYYNAPKRKKVTEYVQYRDIPQITDIAHILISDNPDIRHDKDGVVFTAMNWLENQFKNGTFRYVSDQGEVWEPPEETLTSKRGDCDNFGIVTYFVIREMFKQLDQWEQVKHRLKCVAGNINQRSSIPSGAGGHFYCNWLHSTAEWFTVESTYYRKNAINMFDKIPQKLNNLYGTIWFTFNEEYSWAQHSLTVTKNDFKKII